MPNLQQYNNYLYDEITMPNVYISVGLYIPMILFANLFCIMDRRKKERKKAEL